MSLALAGIVAIGVLAAIGVSVIGKGGGGSAGGGTITTVKGVIGSEKQPFFDDTEVKAAFRSHGLDVHVDTAGSRQIATSTDLSKYDFAFPAGVTAAAKIKADHRTNTSYEPFYTPMVVASFRPIADLLAANGIATSQGAYYTLDMGRYLDLVAHQKRWTDLKGNEGGQVYPAGKAILISSTDIRTSNSAAAYLSIASYSANASNIVQDQGQADKVIPAVAPLFLSQGFTASSSEGPFVDYLSIGIGKTPMVMIYEAQFVGQAALKDGSITKDMVLMYPAPTMFAKHTVVPLNSKGDQVGRLLQDDATLQRLAVKFGFRTRNPAQFIQFATGHSVIVPDSLVNVIDPPTYEVLEYMISTIEKKIGGQ